MFETVRLLNSEIINKQPITTGATVHSSHRAAKEVRNTFRGLLYPVAWLCPPFNAIFVRQV